ncbi:NPCBM/NEW2 domain protein [Symmachiella macrocystis]|uniref:NPCBM/NEW2 domain protein n=1 Tax=Symmachiella macrocystis TaxID=2527985 RepID=A0A5C6BKZ4_9PLAN|nr:NPCBM/NEW2 domain-containing protein [Symmachiella macrocystis]TWU12412.1 NPCBM/NEW2 domain protein [Symmachiella macrocystis]
MGEFDPYHKWLGISPRDQPPSHYRLLGIDEYESDPEVIEAAAERRMSFLHQYVTGDHIADAQGLLNELAAARVCLLDPKRRRLYDQQLASLAKTSPFPSHGSARFRIILMSVALSAIAVLICVFVFVSRVADTDQRDDVADQTISTPNSNAGIPPSHGRELAGDDAELRRPSNESAAVNNSIEVVSDADQQLVLEDSGNRNESTIVEPPPIVIDPGPNPDPNKLDPAQNEVDAQPDRPPTVTEQATTVTPNEDITDKAKLKIPDESSQIVAQRKIRQLFEKDFRYASRTEAKTALAKKLLELGKQKDLDPSERYVSLTLAKELADTAADDQLAEESVTELDRWYDVDVFAFKHAILRRQFRLTRQPEAFAKLAEKALQNAQDALRARRYESASKIAALSQAIARKSKNPRLLVETRVVHDRTQQLQDESSDAMNARKLLETQPLDGRANDTLGHFLCFVENDWEQGTFYLARSDHEEIKLAAQLEQKQNTTDVSQIGDAWWKLAERATGESQQRYQQRARHWYEQATTTPGTFQQKWIASRVQQALEAPFPDQKFFLTDLPEFDLILGPWGFAKHGKKGAYHPDPIMVHGSHVENGIGMHPPGGGHSRARYNLGGKFGTLLGGAVLAAAAGSSGESPVTFSIIADNRLLWTSKPQQAAQQVEDFAIDIRDVEILELRTTCPGGANNCHACWVDPYVIREGGLVRRKR